MANNYGLNDSLEYYEYEFDSSDTANAGNANYSTLDWPLFTSGRPLNNIAAIKILEVQIPFSWYPINSNNNTFTLNEPGFVPTAVTVTLTPGAYNASTLATEIARAMNAVTRFTTSPFYVVSYNSTTEKFTITGQSTAPEQASTWSLQFPSTTTSAALFLGFQADTYASTTTAPTYRTLTSSFVIQVTGPNYLYVNSTKIGQQVNLFLPEGSVTKGEISPQMCKVPINCNPGGVIFWQTADPQKWFDFEDLMNLSQADFYCTLGSTNQVIQFNGVAFSLKLGVLVNRLIHNDTLAGVQHQGRVTKRMRY